MNKKKLSIVIIVLLLVIAGVGGFIFGRLSAGKNAQNTTEESVAKPTGRQETGDVAGDANGTSDNTGTSVSDNANGASDSTGKSGSDTANGTSDSRGTSATDTSNGNSGNSVTTADGSFSTEPTPTAGVTDTAATEPTNTAAAEPTTAPIDTATAEPSAMPIDIAVVEPTVTPTNTATADPTEDPTAALTDTPTAEPSAMPIDIAVVEPTKAPTAAPTKAPTTEPTKVPTATPTAEPTKTPVKAETGTPFDNHGQLAVKGTKLVDKNGEEYRLRGVSTHGIAWFPDYVNKDAFRTLRDDWGANCIRLAMYTAEYNGYCSGGNKSDLKKLVNNGVKYATELGMYVIIDWHILSDSNPQNNQSEALKFFEEMSEKYADSGNVIYEICNEPNGGTGWSQIKSYAEKVIPVIRKNAPDAIIVVGTPTWSQEVDKPAADPIKGYDNIMYTIHFYAATHKDDLRKRMQNAVKSGIALFCTEFGTCDASGNGGNDFNESQKWIDAMESAGVSYCIWNLSNKSETSAQIASSCSKTSGWKESELSASGKWYRNLLRSLTSGQLTSIGDGTGGTGNGSTSGGIGNGTGDKDNGGNNGGTAGGDKDNSGNNGGTSGGNGSGNGGTSDGNKENNGGNGDTAGGNKDNTGDKDNNSSNDTLAPAKSQKGSITATLTHTGGWNDGYNTFYQFTINIQNDGTGEISGWKVTVSFGTEFGLSQSWNGTFEEKGKKLVIGPVDYNSTVAPGQAVEAGFIISSNKEIKDISIVINK